MKRYILSFVTIFLVLCYIIAVVHYFEFKWTYEQKFNSQSPSKRIYSGQFQPHDPIYIQGESDFHTQAKNEGWDLNGIRDGTESAPYIISGYEINSSAVHLMDINNVHNIYFIVINNSLVGNIELPWDGIRLVASEHGTIMNNSIQGCLNGICLHWSINNIISNNTVLGEGMDGILLEYSGNNKVLNNILENSGLTIFGEVIEDYLQTEITSNSVNGKPLVYWQHAIGKTIPSGAGQVILVDCTDITVSSQNLSYSSSGVQIAYSSNLLIDNNIISNNKGDGLYFKNSDYCTISHNIISNNAIFDSNNEMGIAFYSSNYNNISGNAIFNNSNSGIYLRFSCNNNNISGNIITNNSQSGISFSDLPHIIGAEPVAPCNYNLIFNNTLNNNSYHGISVGSCGYNTFLNNSISQNGWWKPVEVGFWGNGIKLDSSYCVVSYNTITHNHDDGINMDNAFNNLLSNNTIANNSEHGITPDFSAHNFFINNNIYNNQKGIRFYNSGNNNISNNNFHNNSNYGISLEHSSESNIIESNCFIRNNLGGTSQAYDDSFNNTITLNFWDDWITPDNDADGIVDLPYSVDGASNNQDPYPLVSMQPFTTTPITTESSTTIPTTIITTTTTPAITETSTTMKTTQPTTSIITGLSPLPFGFIFIIALFTVRLVRKR